MATSAVLTSFIYTFKHTLFPVIVTSVTDNVFGSTVRVGDQLVAVNGKRIGFETESEVYQLLSENKIGNTVNVTVFRRNHNQLHSSAGTLQSTKNLPPQMLISINSPLVSIHTSNTVQASLLERNSLESALKASAERKVAVVNRSSIGHGRSEALRPELQELPHFIKIVCTGPCGVIKLDDFNRKTCGEVINCIRDLESQSFQKHNATLSTLIINLQGNYGGEASACLDTAALFLPCKTPLIQFKLNKQTITYHAINRHPDLSTKLIVVVDKDTASASEVFTCALMDNGRALVVGRKTFGKNLAQGVIPLTHDSALYLSVAEILGPYGRTLRGGIVPHFELPWYQRNSVAF